MANAMIIQNKTVCTTQGLESFDIDACMVSNVGCVREQNEDRILYVKPSDPYLLKTKGILAVVADGMGGHQAGAVASEIAIETIKHAYYNDNQQPELALVQAFINANQDIRTLGQGEPKFNGMGTTATAWVIQQGVLYTAHVGDSRLYLIREGRITQLTEDHSMVMEMVKQGLITPEQARQHPDNNIITRALGTQSHVEVSSSSHAVMIKNGDQLLLSSDGLHDLVNDLEILQVVQGLDVHSACHTLIDLARDRGGYDNISIGIVTIHSARQVKTRAAHTRPG